MRNAFKIPSLLSLSLSVLTAAALEASLSPNILLIISDDQGYGDLGHHGNPVLETPELDHLFQQGLELDHFYVNPVCAPTRASLLTGRYHHRTGTTGVFQGQESMHSSEVTIAELLQEAGYTTGAFGKWHNGDVWPQTPNAQGFDEFYGFTAGVLYDYFDPVLLHNGSEVQDTGFVTDLLTNRAIQFMADAKAEEKPFFCYVPYNVPHTPVQVEDPLFDKYKALGLSDMLAGTYGMLENLDTNVGRLLEFLKAEDLEAETIVIFLGDNGPNFHRYNGGLKGKKASFSEGGVRVPFVVRWPGKIAAGKRVTTHAAHIDILPTLAEICSLATDPGIHLDGVSITPLFFGKDFEHGDRLLYTFPFTHPVDGGPLPGSIRSSRYSAVKSWEAEWGLFDLWADPFEKVNLAKEKPELLEKLKTAYNEKFVEVAAGGIEATPSALGYSESPVVILKSGKAFLNKTAEGGIAFSYENFPLPGNWITDWTDTNAYPIWPVDVVTARRYRVTLHYALAEAGVGVTVSIGSNSERVATVLQQPYEGAEHFIAHRIKTDRIKYRERDWAKAEIGELILAEGKQELTLQLECDFQPGTLEVKAVELKSVH